MTTIERTTPKKPAKTSTQEVRKVHPAPKSGSIPRSVARRAVIKAIASQSGTAPSGTDTEPSETRKVHPAPNPNKGSIPISVARRAVIKAIASQSGTVPSESRG